MSEENKPLPEGERPQRTVRMKLDGKFGVSEERPDNGFRGPDSRISGDRKSFGPRNDRPAFGGGERKPFGDRQGGFRNDRPQHGDRPAYGDRPQHGDRPAFGGGERKPFGDRQGGFRNDRPAFGDRPQHGDRPAFGGGERKSFGDRQGGFRNDRPQHGDRPAFGGGERRPFGDRQGGFRNDRPQHGDRPSYGNRDDRRGERKVWNEGERPGAPVFRQRALENAPEFNEELVPAVLPEGTEENQEILERDPPWFRRLLALSTDKGREREEQFLAEGVRVVAEMIQYHPDIVNGVYINEGFADTALLDKARAANIRIHDLTAEQMAKLSTTVSGPGVVATCRCASRKPDYDVGHVITLVDAIQDPGNLGALFRTSLGFSSGGMVLGKGTVNPFNPKVVRGSSGTFLRVPFEQGIDLAERIQFLRQKGYCIVATDLHAKQSLADIAPRKLRKVAILMGNEGMGADKGLLELADEWVRIPMSQSLESLNVAVAHGILSFQLAQLQEKA